MSKFNYRKSQVWSLDFIIALAMFLAALIMFYKYSANLTAPQNTLSDLVMDAKSISGSLLSAGYPLNWGVGNVVTIGITNSQKINSTKVQRFSYIPYNQTKKLLNAKNHYLVFFENKEGKRIPVGGVCYIGNLNVINITFDPPLAYYYNEDEDMVMKEIMEEQFHADTYCPKDCSGDLDALLTNINNYQIALFEDAKLNKAGKFSDKAVFIENFANNGGWVILSEDVSTAQGDSMLGVEFYKWAGQSEPYANATVAAVDPYLALELGQELSFTQGAYVKDNTTQAKGFKILAQFHDTGHIDGETAAASWNYGSGRAYFFSDIDADYLDEEFKNKVKELLWSGTGCGNISINAKKLISINRFAVYESNILKIRLYAWQ